MTVESYENILKESGAVLTGHFLLTSGLHSDTYVEKFRLLQFPLLTEKLCKAIAENFATTAPHVVVGAATGGIILSHVVARFLSCRSIFAEREETSLLFRRGFKIEEGERVLIVDDVVTTGGSIFEMIDLVVKQGGIIVGIGVLIDRSGGKVNFGFPYFPLVKLDIPTFKPDACPKCLQGIPLTSRGRTGKK
ncbi:MAG: orotate phosphoribosyltransferase [Candidatus Marinimicrobia bacterium]|nr:orotate phosphoribosyltransferase [Candidatus Neomarinimicrobiota bacterium]